MFKLNVTGYSEIHRDQPEKPNEDAWFFNTNTVAVADGITRSQSVGSPYPSMHSTKASNTFVKSVVEKLTGCTAVSIDYLKVAISEANDDIRVVNEQLGINKETVDYLYNDYFGTTGIVLHADIFTGKVVLGYAGDVIAIYLPVNGIPQLITRDQQHGWHTGLYQTFTDKIKRSIYQRKVVRNNPEAHDGDTFIGFGAFTGESSVINFVEVTEIQVNPGDRFILATDALRTTACVVRDEEEDIASYQSALKALEGFPVEEWPRILIELTRQCEVETQTRSDDATIVVIEVTNPEADWQIKSNYAIVSCFPYGNKLFVEKQIAPDRVTSGNSKWVNDVSKYFRAKLQDLGVPLAEPYICFEQDGHAIQISPYVGSDLERIFSEGQGNYRVLEDLIEAMQGVMLQEPPEVGLDARLSNFCLDKGGAIFYIDTFPPLVKFEDEILVHFPNPKDEVILKQEFFRKFQPKGILRRLRFNLLEQETKFGEKELLAAIRAVMGDNFYFSIADFFANLPDKLPSEEALEIITLDDPDGIREVAIKFMPPKGDDRSEFIREIFNLSSNYCPYQLNPLQRMQQVRNLINQSIRGERIHLVI